MDKKFVSEFVKAAANYGRAEYQLYESVEQVKRQQSYLRNLQSWIKKAPSSDARKNLIQEILLRRELLKRDEAYAQRLSKQVTRLEHGIEKSTRRLLADDRVTSSRQRGPR